MLWLLTCKRPALSLSPSWLPRPYLGVISDLMAFSMLVAFLLQLSRLLLTPLCDVRSPCSP
jgi:hypothetical protein